MERTGNKPLAIIAAMIVLAVISTLALILVIDARGKLTANRVATSLAESSSPIHLKSFLSQANGVTGNTFLRRDGTEAMTGGLGFAPGAGLRTGPAAGDTLLLQARDTDAASWTALGTLTSGTDPTLSLAGPIITGSPTAAGATWSDLGSVTTADINGGTLDSVSITRGTWSNTSSKATSIARTVALVVCASNALSKAQCDYVADGTADNVEIQAAMNAGNSVKLSDGTFYIAATITMSDYAELWLDGAATLVLAGSANSNMFDVTGTDFVHIYGGVLDGNMAANKLGMGIYGDNVRYLRGHNMYFHDWPEEGIKVVSTTESEGISITDVTMGDMNGYGISFMGVKDSVIQNFHAENTIVGTTRHAIHLYGVVSVSVTQSMISASGDGILVTKNSRYVVLDGNVIDNATGYGIALVNNEPIADRASHIIVSNNAMYHNSKGGIYLIKHALRDNHRQRVQPERTDRRCLLWHRVEQQLP